MTFASAILALGPTIYWECQDSSGPVATDSSGNSNAGSFYGNYALRQPGVTAGEFSVLFPNGGGLHTPSQSPRAVRPLSMMTFIAIGLFGPTNGGLIYNGNGSIDGSGTVFNAPSSVSQAINLLHGGQGQSAALGGMSLNTWHHVAVSESVAGNTIVWVDNAQVSNTAGNNPINPGASSPFQINSPLPSGQLFYAHAALFPAVLTNANVNSVYTAAAFQAPGPILTITPVDIADIKADLAAILAAVQKIFPTT